jgi:predicted nucleic acid-binding protein
MIERFVDTSGWAELVDRTLMFHALAVEKFDQAWNQGGRLITTNLVLIELTALLTSPLRMPKSQQIRLIADLRGDSALEVVFIDSVRETEAWNLWNARPDKTWSLVDCASFVVMQQRGFTEALTTDYHFEQAGFVRLLK